MTAPTVAEAIHLCSVPATALPELAQREVVVDLDAYEFGRRQVGRLLEATYRADEHVVVGVIELTIHQRDRDRPQLRVPVTARNGFRVPADRRVTAHLPTSLLRSTDGAVDVEFG